MTTGQYLLGVGLLALTLASLALVATRVRAWLAPDWRGAPARLAELVSALALLLLVAQLLGAVGALQAGFLVAVCVAGAAAATRLKPPRRGPVPLSEPRLPPQGGRLSIGVSLLAVALVFLHWGSRSVEVLRRGMEDPDTLWYHMPHAARFAQDGWTTRLHFTESEPITTFHPANSELLHSIGISLLGGFDLLSPFLNLGFAALCLLAAWCIGRPFGAAPAALTGVAAVLLLPIMIQTQPGEAYNDVSGLAFFLAAVGLLTCARWRRGPLAIAGVAAGLAVGTKLSLLVPAVVLAVGVVVAAPQGTRFRTAALWGSALLGAGGYWFLRNLGRTGNPLPWFGLDLGPVTLPSPPNPVTDAASFSVAHYLFDSGVWRDTFLPGLDASLGPAWILVVLLPLAAAGLALAAGRSRLERALGAVGVACFAAYAITPAGAGGPEGAPSLFGLNLRFLTPALALGLATLPTLRLPGGDTTRRALAPALLLLTLIVLAGDGLWPPEGGWAGLGLVGIAAAMLAGTPALVRRPRRELAVGLALLAPLVIVGGSRVQQAYFDERYTMEGPSVPPPSLWARDLHHSRVGLVGYLLQYPLYGTDLSNHVQFVGERGAHGAFRRFRSCDRWAAALARGRYRYVLTAAEGSIALGPAGTGPPAEPREARWTRSIAGATEIERFPRFGAALFRLRDPLGLARCR